MLLFFVTSPCPGPVFGPRPGLSNGPSPGTGPNLVPVLGPSLGPVIFLVPVLGPSLGPVIFLVPVKISGPVFGSVVLIIIHEPYCIVLVTYYISQVPGC